MVSPRLSLWVEAEQVSDQSCCGSAKHNSPRLGQPEQLVRHLGCVAYCQGNLVRVSPDGTYDHLPGMQAHAHGPLLRCPWPQRRACVSQAFLKA
jgi:hypothetical protein